MTKSDFFPFHNFHIEFKLNNGMKLSGVVVDPMNHQKTNKPSTMYDYIPVKSMIEWKHAEQNGDKKTMELLQKEIDIVDIVWAQRFY